MPHPKNIAFLLLLLFAAISCKKKQPHPTEAPKTGIHKIEGKRVWKGKLSIDFDPKPPPYYGHYDTSYEITFNNNIYVLDDSTISYSPDSSGDIYEYCTELFLQDLSAKNQKYYFASIYTHSHSEVMSYYYELDSFFWEKGWTTDSNWRYGMSVHSP